MLTRQVTLRFESAVHHNLKHKERTFIVNRNSVEGGEYGSYGVSAKCEQCAKC